MAYCLTLTRVIAVAGVILLCQCQSCDPEVPSPLSIPVRNVSLQNPVVRRGVVMSLGTPPQPFAFSIDPYINNTFVYDQTGLCDPVNPSIQCTGLNGGTLDQSKSSTWRAATSLATQDQGLNQSSPDQFGYDTMFLNSSLSLTSFPLDIARTRNFPMNTLGFGSASTILQSLKNAGVIPSKSFSIFWGLTGAIPEHQVDGNVVLGGYDAAKTTGPNYTFPFAPTAGCESGLVTTVIDITMDFPNGTKQSIIGTAEGSAQRFCIQPRYPIITIHSDMWDIFQQWAGGTYLGRSFGLNLYGELYAPENVYSGDLTFTFINGLQITIPNHQLVIPDLQMNPDGTAWANYSSREILLNSNQEINANDMTLLGMTFLTSAYLYVNYDQGNFMLWQANGTTEQKLVGVGPSGTSCATRTTHAASSTSAPGGSATSTPASSAPTNSKSTGISLSVVIGAAIAGAAILLALIAAFLYIRRRRRRVQQAVQPAYGEGQSLDQLFSKPELPGANYRNSGFPGGTLKINRTMDEHENHGGYYRDQSSMPYELD